MRGEVIELFGSVENFIDFHTQSFNFGDIERFTF